MPLVVAEVRTHETFPPLAVIGRAEVQEFVDDAVVGDLFIEVAEFDVEDEQVGRLVYDAHVLFIARIEMIYTSPPIFSAHSRAARMFPRIATSPLTP